MDTNDDTMKINRDPRGGPWLMAKNMGMAQGPGNYPELVVERGNDGLFTFLIQTRDNVTFGKDPFVPKANPTSPSDFHSQLKPIQGGEGYKYLIVKDYNSSPQGGTYHYQLQFSNGTTLDPIITNNGCCRAFYETDAFLVTGGIMMLALFAYLVRRLVVSQRQPA